MTIRCSASGEGQADTVASARACSRWSRCGDPRGIFLHVHVWRTSWLKIFIEASYDRNKFW